MLTVLVQSILEGGTDCPISGVFGAGKIRAAAAMIAGLLVMESTLKVMVVTKEYAAAHAFAKNIGSLQLPPSLEEKFGRLVGAIELEKVPDSQTKLDIVPGYRNTVLRTKQVSCGGGFHQECTQPYSPVAQMLMLLSMMRANSMETWMRPLPLREFLARALLFGVGTTNKRQADCARVRKHECSDAN